LIWAWASGGTVWELGLTVVVVVGAGAVGAVVVVVFGGCVGGGLTTVVVGWGRVDGALDVGGDVWGGAVVVGGGPTSWAWACQMAPAAKVVTPSVTIPAARKRDLTPLLFSPPRLFACSLAESLLVNLNYCAHSR
jgi:hypothetical protein